MKYNLKNYPSIRTHESEKEFIHRVNDWEIGFEKELRNKLALSNGALNTIESKGLITNTMRLLASSNKGMLEEILGDSE